MAKRPVGIDLFAGAGGMSLGFESRGTATEETYDADGTLQGARSSPFQLTFAMRRATETGMLAATDLADHLARGGVPFREAHEIVGRIVRDRLAAGKDLAGVTLEELQKVDPRFTASALEEITTARSLASRTSPGGTAPERVRAALEDARRTLRG